jgi:hypothetical protein
LLSDLNKPEAFAARSSPASVPRTPQAPSLGQGAKVPFHPLEEGPRSPLRLRMDYRPERPKTCARNDSGTELITLHRSDLGP